MESNQPASQQLQHTYVSPEEVQALIPGVTVRALAGWRSEGRGPQYRKLGRAILYDLAEVEEWIESRVRRGTRLPAVGDESRAATS